MTPSQKRVLNKIKKLTKFLDENRKEREKIRQKHDETVAEIIKLLDENRKES